MGDDELAATLSALTGAERVEDVRRLSGGASRETFSFDALDRDGHRRPLVAQRDRPGAAASTGMAVQARLLRSAAAVGVPVPRVVATDREGTTVVLERLAGETIPRRILRDEAWAAARPRLAAQCGGALAAVHAIPTEEVPELEAPDQLARYREVLDALGEAHPALELGFRWLEAHRPPAGPVTVVHGDFRNGNLVVGADGLVAVLDWELAHLGDPLEDLGWLCVKSWRFGSALRVGGFGTVDDLVEAYEEASGRSVDRAALAWWETLGTLKWGIMCIMQAATHLSGAVRSVELAAIGRRVCEVEHDLLLLLP
jgi:aminoglycoside phosphotransferase (APT) family kinase protein